jgi:hypothetical protein
MISVFDFVLFEEVQLWINPIGLLIDEAGLRRNFKYLLQLTFVLIQAVLSISKRPIFGHLNFLELASYKEPVFSVANYL